MNVLSRFKMPEQLWEEWHRDDFFLNFLFSYIRKLINMFIISIFSKVNKNFD